MLSLLKEMSAIHAPSGNEGAMTDFLLNYIEQNKANWNVQPEIYSGDGFQETIVLKFGTPRTAFTDDIIFFLLNLLFCSNTMV